MPPCIGASALQPAIASNEPTLSCQEMCSTARSRSRRARAYLGPLSRPRDGHGSPASPGPGGGKRSPELVSGEPGSEASPAISVAPPCADSSGETGAAMPLPPATASAGGVTASNDSRVVSLARTMVLRWIGNRPGAANSMITAPVVDRSGLVGSRPRENAVETHLRRQWAPLGFRWYPGDPPTRSSDCFSTASVLRDPDVAAVRQRLAKAFRRRHPPPQRLLRQPHLRQRLRRMVYRDKPARTPSTPPRRPPRDAARRRRE